MTHVLWIASHGPDRSHDTLNSQSFERQSDAWAFVEGKSYWRISRMEFAEPWSPATKRTDEIGGIDVAKEVERVRQQEQARTGRRVTEAKALALWRQRIAERRGGGGFPNPVRRRKNAMSRRARRSFNDRERELWVLNDEFLHSMQRGSGMSMRKFIRAHRAEIDAAIVQATTRDADRPSGYGQYPRSYNPRGRKAGWVFSLTKTGASGSFIRRPKSKKKAKKRNPRGSKFMIHFRGSPYSNELYDERGREIHDLRTAIAEAKRQYPGEKFEVYSGEEAWATPERHSAKKRNPRRRKPDFILYDLGTVAAFLPNTRAAKTFARQLPLESWQRRGPTFVVDRRPAAALAEQLMEEGWTIAEGSW